MPHALIATLGRSPGTVTGLYNALVEQREADPSFRIKRIERIFLLMTEDEGVKRAADIIEEALDERFGRKAPRVEQCMFEYEDVSAEQIQAFKQQVLEIMHELTADEWRLVVGVTGGLVSMGVTLAASAYTYGVDAMYYFRVTDELTRSGSVYKLDSGEIDPKIRQDVLFPPPEQRSVVPLRVDIAILRRESQEINAQWAYKSQLNAEERSLLVDILKSKFQDRDLLELVYRLGFEKYENLPGNTYDEKVVAFLDRVAQREDFTTDKVLAQISRMRPDIDLSTFRVPTG